MEINDLYKKYNEKIRKLDLIEKEFPLEYIELIAEIDRFIFGANKGYHLSTQAQIIAKDILNEAQNRYNLKYFSEIRGLKAEKAPSTILKELARANCSKEKEELNDAENIDIISGILRADWQEKLNTYKKIKDGNRNER